MSLNQRSDGEQFVQEDSRRKRLYLQHLLAVSSLQFFLVQQKDGARTYTVDKIRLSHPKQPARLIATMGYAWQAESAIGTRRETFWFESSSRRLVVRGTHKKAREMAQLYEPPRKPQAEIRHQYLVLRPQ